MQNEFVEREERTRWSVAWPVAQFALAGIVAVVIVVIATSLASGRVGEREAIVDARSQTLVRARDVVEPLVTDGLLTSEPAAVNAVDDVVRRAVLDASLIRVKIWRADGTIIYSDEARLIGTQYDLGEEELTSLAGGAVEAEVSDLGKPENRFERDQGKMLEVYLPIHTPNGTAVLFEAYFRYRSVVSSGSRVWRSFAPFTIGALVLLELIQIPLAWRLARRLQQRRRERERLLRQALDASDLERRRVASDLHDGVVQDLVGVALSLASAARAPTVDPAAAALLDESAAGVRESIKTLRSLLIEIYPPNLFEEGLGAALDDLLARAHGRGITTSLDTTTMMLSLDASAARVLYRVAQEALRNVVSHSGATTVHLRVATTDRLASLEVVDNGTGFDPDILRSMPSEGHFGLRGLADLLTDAGGRLIVSSSAEAGTTIRAEVPR